MDDHTHDKHFFHFLSEVSATPEELFGMRCDNCGKPIGTIIGTVHMHTCGMKEGNTSMICRECWITLTKGVGDAIKEAMKKEPVQ